MSAEDEASPGSSDVAGLSRSLLTPGPQPPLSHFGATLLRHVVATTLRYTFYHLGMPMPEAPPVRFLRLRLFLDSIPLEDLVGAEPGGAELVAAIMDPGGAAVMDHGGLRLRAAGTLHRMRLRFLGPKRHPPREQEEKGGDRAELWAHFQERLSRRMPHLCDLVLWEVCESLHRRQRRAAGVAVEPSLGKEAWQWRRGDHAALASLGPPDPLLPCWTDETTRPRVGPPDGMLGPLPRLPSGRGAFREGYRRFLSELRPTLFDLGWRLAEEGLIAEADDIFFVPYDLGDELAKEAPAGWLREAMATNRREYESLEGEPEHDDEIHGSPALAKLADRSADWSWTPLRPVA